MGHKRGASLPKTEKWQSIVGLIASCSSSAFDVSQLAQQTLENVRDRFERIARDESTHEVFKYLVEIAVAARSSDADPDGLGRLAGTSADYITPLGLAAALRPLLEHTASNPEYAAIAQAAATDALAVWYDQHRSKHESLFESLSSPADAWRMAGNGAGFCELSRLFFGRYVERYLNYFLEREASSVLRDVGQREKFRTAIDEHVERISRHAFETAKITQSFAAGWFNRNAAQGTPSDEQIEGFLDHAFGKLRAELAIEGNRS